MRRNKTQVQHSDCIMDKPHNYTDDYLTVVLKKAEIVLRHIKPTRLQYDKEKED